METYVFDGSLTGLLSAVFIAYERRSDAVKVVSQDRYQPDLLGGGIKIDADSRQADRVWKGLAKRVGAAGLNTFYAAFLGEDAQGYQSLFDLSRAVFDRGGDIMEDFGNVQLLFVSQLARKVHREKHRMEAFVRFQKTADGLFTSFVAPDYNVLPLIRRHFTDRYADQRWLIYDSKRKYGLYYDGDSTAEVEIEFSGPTGKMRTSSLPENVLAEDEGLYQRLWKGYFNHTNIAARKNTKLHIRHIPKRYWRYLTEKSDLHL
ncbi:DNA metabolism protein [Parapedobacter defluvii]|uniref:DNA metabolism protein n=1 Tax=Parapedobacter defluvii TaxID=2045106 RepID=A0ABQ1LNH5_9SPHI|nr:TIGR03915 family putative DNA repair protein [Parapedobacter defluvii]GGC27495.1 DNA metabolism protein [Parapedobacter defluvii]